MKGAKSSGRQQHLIMNESHHLGQSDAGPIITWEAQVFLLRRWPQSHLADLYILNSQLMLAFMSKLDEDEGSERYFDVNQIKRRIAEY